MPKVHSCAFAEACLQMKHAMQVVKVPTSQAEDAMLTVQMGFLQVAVKMSEVQQKQV